jgi:hypothetical protein
MPYENAIQNPFIFLNSVDSDPTFQVAPIANITAGKPGLAALSTPGQRSDDCASKR